MALVVTLGCVGPAVAASVPLSLPAPVDLRSLLTGSGAPTAAEVERLVAHLGDRDPAVRAAVVARLAPYPRACASRLVALLGERRLSAQLEAVDLLVSWKAPVEGLDPWQPGSLSVRVPKLLSWCRTAPESCAPARPTSGPAGAVDAPPGPGTAPDRPDSADVQRELRALPLASDERADAVIERLARVGPAIVPQVRRLEEEASEPRARERYAILRYRVATPVALILREPDLPRWLARVEGARRVQALDQLSAWPSEEVRPVLVELFLDPQPLVREAALKALRARHDIDVADDLARLLSDPSPNVRATVLKELTEHPLPRIVPRLAGFVAHERDEDLLVHAARALGATRSKAALRCLIGLFDHPVWRVRAEAAEAVQRRLSSRGAAPDSELLERICVRTRALLSDKDGYVVSRGIALSGELMLADSAPVIAAIAERDESLAVPALEVLAKGGDTNPVVDRTLRKLLTSRSAAVREAATRALAKLTRTSVADEVHRALLDPAPAVRLAALTGLVEMLRATADRRSELASGKKFPPSLSRPLVKDVTPLLAATSPRERLAAATVLAILGEGARAFPAVRNVVARDLMLRAEAGAVLRHLDWADRKQLFERLVAPGPDFEGALPGLVDGLVADAPAEAVPYLWGLVTGRTWIRTVLDKITEAVIRIPVGDNYLGNNYLGIKPGRAVLAEMARQARANLDSARPAPAAAALRVLLFSDSETVDQELLRLCDDPAASPEVRRNALRLRLYAGTNSTCRTQVAGLLKRREAWAMEPVLAWIAVGRTAEPVRRLTVDGQPALDLSRASELQSPGDPPATLPPELTADTLRPLLASREGNVACYAAHLLARLGDRSGIAVLVERARDAEEADDPVPDLLVDSIVALDDDSLVPHLERRYRALDEETAKIRELYGKIRPMTGPNAKDLRKRMRREIGAGEGR